MVNRKRSNAHALFCQAKPFQSSTSQCRFFSHQRYAIPHRRDSIPMHCFAIRVCAVAIPLRFLANRSPSSPFRITAMPCTSLPIQFSALSAHHDGSHFPGSAIQFRRYASQILRIVACAFHLPFRASPGRCLAYSIHRTCGSLRIFAVTLHFLAFPRQVGSGLFRLVAGLSVQILCNSLHSFSGAVPFLAFPARFRSLLFSSDAQQLTPMPFP